MTFALGVTGGIGSGKSTVCRILESLGARIFYADDEGKAILANDPGARAELVELVGPEAYRGGGTLDRSYVAEVVFGDPEKLARLNAIVHPRVREAFARALERADEDGVRVLVKEAALLFESGADQELDAVLLVDAPADRRIERVVERDGVSPDRVIDRMSHQTNPETHYDRADYVLFNDGTIDDLDVNVRSFYADLLRRIDADRRSDEPPDP